MNTHTKTYKKVGIALVGILFAVIFSAYIKGTYLSNFDAKIAPKQLINWDITSWEMNGQGGWKQQPVILVDGQKPFYADHPDAYIKKLLELYKNPAMVRGRFQTLIGELRDGLDNAWEVKQ